MPTSKGREGKGGQGRRGRKERGGQGGEGRAGERKGVRFLVSRPGNPTWNRLVVYQLVLVIIAVEVNLSVFHAL